MMFLFKKMAVRTTALVMWLLPASLILAPACETQENQLCDDQCDCVPCTDREHKLCEKLSGYERDRATAYDCVVEYEDYLACIVDQQECNDLDDNNNPGWSYDQDCDAEEGVDYFECIDDSSDIGGF